MSYGSSNEIILHLQSGQPVRISAGNVAYIDEDRDARGAVTGTRVVVSEVDESGNPISYCVKEACYSVAQQLTDIVCPRGIGDGDA